MGNRYSILVVEDDHDIRVALRQYLEEAGYFVISATNGADALQLLEKVSAPSVFLLDLRMPLMNGDEFLRIWKNNPSFASIPIIQMSAESNLKREGTFASLSKPLDMEKLLTTIEACRATHSKS